MRPEYEALTGDPEDVVLWRTLEGEAHASIPPRSPALSPTGIEWGYGGSGPADLARSVLLALTDEPTANALYHRFKHEVVASVPEEGGVLRAADVRRWVERARCYTRAEEAARLHSARRAGEPLPRWRGAAPAPGRTPQ